VVARTRRNVNLYVQYLSCYFDIFSCPFLRHYVIYETQKISFCSKETNYFCIRLEKLPETHNMSLVFMVTADKLGTWIHRPYWPKRNRTETTIPHGQNLLGSAYAPRTIYSLLSHAPTNTTTFRLANNFCNWLATQQGTLCLFCLAAFHTAYHRAELHDKQTVA